VLQATTPEHVQQYGVLDKLQPEEMHLLNRLYAEADVFILPSLQPGAWDTLQ
jgi:hypothetical protein